MWAGMPGTVIDMSPSLKSCDRPMPSSRVSVPGAPTPAQPNFRSGEFAIPYHRHDARLYRERQVLSISSEEKRYAAHLA